MARGGIGLRLVDGVLPVLGLVLLVIGATGVKLAVVFAWGVLALSFLGWLAEANGLPRPGRLPIRSYGCWETPLARPGSSKRGSASERCFRSRTV